MEDAKAVEIRRQTQEKNPFIKANILGKVFFTWTFPLFLKGYKKDLLEEDLYAALPSHESKYLGDKLDKEWSKELKVKKKSSSLWMALARVFGKEMAFQAVCYLLCEILARITVPLFLSQLLEYFEPQSVMSKQTAYYYAGAIATCVFLSSAFQHHYMLHNYHLGMKLRVATSSIIYRKVLKLNKSALAETTVGQMVNLISNDVARFERATLHIHSLWMAPLETIIVIVIMYYSVGYTAMIGVLLLLASIPFQIWMGKKTSTFRLATAIRTDERIRLMNEIISGIQVIKMYTWEKPFAKLVEISRRREIDEIKKISIVRAIIMSLNIFLNSTAVYLCILTYVLTNKIVDAQYVYLIQSFYGVLRTTLTMFFPQGVTEFAEANISIKRIRRFLMYDEVDFDSSATFINNSQSSETLKPDLTKHDELAVRISIKDASLRWLNDRTENNLDHLDLEVNSGELTVVIGAVGSGKTTLLHGILGELKPVKGSTKVTGNISYASQEPWLFVGSVRQNIIFGQKFDATRYHEVVRACQLERDFTLFPYGDRTIVGERGVSLSGGQRARINLARAVYKDSDIYLLDDPLSAVDAQVGKQIFEECITGYLKDKCVVLVTHQLQYLKHVKKIYLLGDRKIEHSGTYKEIRSSGKQFSKLLEDLKDIMDEDEMVEKYDLKPIRRRRISTKEAVPKNDKKPAMVKEGRGEGKVAWSIYKTYFLSSGHCCKIWTIFLIFVLVQVLSSFLELYLKEWVNINQFKKIQQDSYIPPVYNLTTNDSFPIVENVFSSTEPSSVLPALSSFELFWINHLSDDLVLYIYSLGIVLLIVLTISRSLAFYRCCNKASVRLHNNMFYKTVYASLRFFNTNPSGRILNRFSKDMNQVDEVLPLCLLDSLQIFLTVIGICSVIASVNPWMLLFTGVMLTIFYFLRVIFLATSRDLKRLEGITRSPVYSHLTASLQGLTTIRAFGAQKILKNEFDNYQNSNCSAYFMFLAANRTFGFWLDMHCVVFITFVTFSFLLFNTGTFGGNVGLAITQAMNLTRMFQWGMRQWSELENTMTCVERIQEYADIVPEQDGATHDPPKSWPATGDIKFDNLCLKYTPEEPLVLKNLTFHIRSTEKVGIVGRTGAGKSSIIIALFRLAVNEGRIIIDGLDISKIPLSRLRSSISIIPQEPVLFSGSLRKNLDPFEEYTDEVIWRALEEVELKQVVSNFPQGLASKMSEGGSNFSVGQRQLVCLARAIVKNNKILVLDEATANVDPQTDALIQNTIRRKFPDCTVLTIAHRLHTIMDSDKVVVMDAGRIVEFGHPHELLQKKENGVFYELVQQTGGAMADNLIAIAHENYLEKSTKNSDT
ncbi:probable multidrug resistance-associated protein lethal(2)03659 [Anthonomus grandis grandis]|uniref:probable multidrug resistance-associated protein lethal(2)03659 n=1 Tax=Anthonomus grandis grandis TaxID=2921223 RepID=UPI0021665C9A|nr:probable multidrug resistance-associated protein lethal(2)03659 [Anthonomus grandis grandis]